MDYKQFWIFEIVGGEPFKIGIPGNPVQNHDGERTLIRCLIFDSQVKEVQAQLVSSGGKLTLSNSPRETEEDRDQRQNLLKILGEDTALPCAQCPECSWFDPYMVGLCGAGRSYTTKETWASFTEQLQVPKYQKDYESCPIPIQ